MGLLLVGASILALQVATVGAVTAPVAGQHGPLPGTQLSPLSEQQQQQSAPPSTKPSDTSNDAYSIDRIRRQLQRPALKAPAPDSNLPRYRVEVYGKRFELPSWKDKIGTAPSPVPVPIGGVNYYDMTRLNTRPELFTNREGLGMMQVALETQLGLFLIRKTIEAQRRAIVQQAREEVQRELAEVLAHNARVAAGQNDPKAKTEVKKK